MSRRPRIGLTLELIDPIIATRRRAHARGHRGRGRARRRDPALGRSRELAGRLRARRRRRDDGRPRRRGRALRGRRRTRSRSPGHAGFDTTELGLARACLRDGKPVLGICRGSQVLNVAAGGTLVQDVPSTGTDAACTWASGCAWWTTRRAATTRSRCSPGTRLADWLGAGTHVVNSYHHQAVERLGDGLRTAAVAPDGTIEADRVDERRLRRRPAVAQRVPHARGRALRASAAGARRAPRARRRREAGGGRAGRAPARPRRSTSSCSFMPGAVGEHEPRRSGRDRGPRPGPRGRACRRSA